MPSISRHIFSCLKFNFRYYYAEDFTRHRLRCLDLDEFQCQDCDFFSSSVKVLTDIFQSFSDVMYNASGDCRAQDVHTPVESVGGPETRILQLRWEKPPLVYFCKFSNFSPFWPFRKRLIPFKVAFIIIIIRFKCHIMWTYIWSSPMHSWYIFVQLVQMYTYSHYQFDYIKPINQSKQKSKLSNAKPVEMHVPRKKWKCDIPRDPNTYQLYSNVPQLLDQFFCGE